MDFKDPNNFIHIAPKLNPGIIEDWILMINNGKSKKKKKEEDKGNQRRSDFSMKVKKHLSALGWGFSYALLKGGNKKELRYKSPQGKWYYSLATACIEQQQQQQIVGEEEKVTCSSRNLSLGLTDSVEIVTKFDLSKQDKAEDSDVSCSAPSQESDLVTTVPVFDELSQKEKENRVEDSVMIVSKFDGLEKKKRKRVNDCDYTAVFNEETLEEKEKNHSCDLVINVFNDEKKKRRNIVGTDEWNQKQKENRAEDCVKMDPEFDELKKKRKRIKDCIERAAFNAKTPKTEDKKNLSIRIVDMPQKKKRRKKEEESEIRPRIKKSLKNILRLMDEKKEEKESLRFWRKDCGFEMNSEVCCFCHHGGELLLCDGCPSSFHYGCLGLSSLPEEELWFCPCCCCDVCKSRESGNNTLMSCEQCQRRFHLKCLEDKGSPSSVSCRGWFCSSQCDRVFTALQNLLNCKIKLGGSEESDLVWTLMRAPNELEHYEEEKMSKLDSAVKILHEGFEPSKDLLSRKDLVEEMIYRRERGFYMVIVKTKKEHVTVAVIRVGKNEAEIPLVATLWDHRRSGLCRLLMDELEKQLRGMGVCRLVLPAAEEVVDTWTQRSGFSIMKRSEKLEVVKHGMLDFVGIVMCHKFLNIGKTTTTTTTTTTSIRRRFSILGLTVTRKITLR